MLVTFDGTNAGYDGVATLGGVDGGGIGGTDYTLNVMAAGASYTDKGQTIDVDMGGDTITFQNTAASYWHVNGSGDTAILDPAYSYATLAYPVELYFTGAMAQYAIAYNAAGNLTVTGGSTGTTTIDLAGGEGELNFADGSVIGLGPIGDDVDEENAIFTINCVTHRFQCATHLQLKVTKFEVGQQMI